MLGQLGWGLAAVLGFVLLGGGDDGAKLLGLLLIVVVAYRILGGKGRPNGDQPRVVASPPVRPAPALIPPHVRRWVFNNDANTCQYCGRSAPDVQLEIDHIVPVSKGGTNDFSNLVTACGACNRAKGARIFDDEGVRRFQEARMARVRASEREREPERAKRRGCALLPFVFVLAGAFAGGLVLI